MSEKRFQGIHLMPGFDLDKTVDLILLLNPRMVKYFGIDASEFSRLITALRGHGFVADYYVYRPWYNDQLIGRQDQWNKLHAAGTNHNSSGSWFDPQKAYEQWKRAVTFGTLEHLAGVGIPIYVELLNEAEIDLFQEGNRLKSNRLSFEKQATAMLKYEYNLRAVALNIPSGNSNPDIFRAAGTFTGVGLYQVLRDNQGAIGTHAYAGLFMQLWHLDAQAIDSNAGNYALRESPKWYVDNAYVADVAAVRSSSYLAFRPFSEVAWMQEFEGGGVDVLLTEHGFDKTGAQTYMRYTDGKELGGWRYFAEYWDKLGFLEGGKTPAQFHAEQLFYADRQYVKEPQVKAAAIYCAGLWKTEFDPAYGKSFDILDSDGLSETITALDSLYTGEPPETDPGNGTQEPSGCEPLSLLVNAAKQFVSTP